MSYRNQIGRLRVEVSESAAQGHDYKYGASILFYEHEGDEFAGVTEYLSVEELRDLRYLLDRAIAVAEEDREEFKRFRMPRAA